MKQSFTTRAWHKIACSLILAASFITATTHERTTYALDYKTVATMAGLYALSAYIKNPVKELSHDTVSYWGNVENLNEELAVKSVAKMLERGLWAVVAFATHDGLILVGMPSAAATAATTSFTAGLTLPFVKDMLNNVKKWYQTLDKNEHATAIKAWYYQPHFDLVHPIQTTHTTQPWCGSANPLCVHHKLERPLNHLSVNSPLSATPDAITFPWNDLLMLAPEFAKETGIILLGYQIGWQSYKLGSYVASGAIKQFVPGYNEHNILNAEEYEKVAFTAKKMMQKYIEAYLPGMLYHQVIKPAVTKHIDPKIEDHEDTSYFVGLFAEIFKYVPWQEHKALIS